MAIDLNTETKAYSLEDLKSRAQSNLASMGIGSPERIANIERLLYWIAGSLGLITLSSGTYVPSTTHQAQMALIGDLLQAQDIDYEQEILDNESLKQVLAYEEAIRRLAKRDVTVAVPAIPAGYVDATVQTVAIGSIVRNKAKTVNLEYGVVTSNDGTNVTIDVIDHTINDLTPTGASTFKLSNAVVVEWFDGTPGIPAEPAMIDVYEVDATGAQVLDAQGNPIIVSSYPNPIVVRDAAERTAAQSIVIGATTATVNLATTRGFV